MKEDKGVDDEKNRNWGAELENGVPDILDEARVELEWFLEMQIQNGENAGLVYHKLHDLEWTGLPTAPHEDLQPRYVHPPTTSATLNASAVFAQAARVWEKLDPTFSAICLEAAELAYSAAVANPELYADSSDVGGGPYDDDDFEDEFYWAASELYITTGRSEYEADMAASPLHLTVPTPNGDEENVSMMTWADTNALGAISLATVGEWFGRDDSWVRAARASVVAAADIYKAKLETGYGNTLNADEYFWGSNSFVLNNMVGLALAQDFSCDESFADAMHETAAYLLGRNPLGTSYVTGYGSNAVENPHHRFFANILNPSYPVVPAGTVSGGPNLGLQDPVAQGLTGCASQRCFLDDINAWSLNEMTINWNAPLAWTTAYLDEVGNSQLRQAAQARCESREQHFLSFEDPSSPWSSVGASVHTVAGGLDGANALAVDGSGWTWVNAPEFTTDDVEIIGDTLAIDVKLSTEQSNPWWLGDVAVFMSVAGTSQQMKYLGRVPFNGRPLGEWFTASFPLSEAMQQAVLSGAKVKIQITPNTNNSAAPLVIDNVRFSGNILTR